MISLRHYFVALIWLVAALASGSQAAEASAAGGAAAQRMGATFDTGVAAASLAPGWDVGYNLAQGKYADATIALGMEVVGPLCDLKKADKAHKDADNLRSVKKAKGGVGNTPKTPMGLCFTAGTLVATDDGKVAIETLEVGDRVTTTHQAKQSSSTEVDPRTWRKITLQMPNPEFTSDVLDIEVLRSVEWMEVFRCEEGATIDFVLKEMGLRGSASVVRIEPCPAIAEGEGRVVLATVTHFNGNVYRIRLANGQTLEPTGRHQLFSATREAWTPTAFLEVGEVLKTRSGNVLIEGIEQLSGIRRVHNIEVETEHCYYVGETEVLSHNTNPCAQPLPNRPPNLSPEGAGRRGAFREAKRQAGVPTSQQPSRVLPNVDRRGNPQLGKIYEFDVPASGGGTRTIRIRDDAGGHNFGPGNPQNRGSHFNDPAGGHFDY